MPIRLIDREIVWDIVANKVPELERQTKELVADEFQGEA